MNKNTIRLPRMAKRFFARNMMSTLPLRMMVLMKKQVKMTVRVIQSKTMSNSLPEALSWPSSVRSLVEALRLLRKKLNSLNENKTCLTKIYKESSNRNIKVNSLPI